AAQAHARQNVREDGEGQHHPHGERHGRARDAVVEQKKLRRERDERAEERHAEQELGGEHAHREAYGGRVHSKTSSANAFSLKVKRDPCPRRLESSSCPPCIATRRRAMARPSPVPFRRAAVSPACAYSS